MISLETLKKDKQYSFLFTEFNNNPIQYLTLAGSISYGTNNENSDIDIRGFFLESIEELLSLQTRREHYAEPITDTVLYSLQNFVTLLTSCNPNVIELLGVKKEHILYESLLAKSLRQNSSLFLSKKAYFTFIGYATAQLRRLQNALAHDTYDAEDKEKHILKTIEYELQRSENDFKMLNKNHYYKLYIDKSIDNIPEIFCDLKFNHISLRDLANRINQLHATIRNFDKLNHRNRKKDDNHLNKHAMHLIRLLLTGIDILNNGIIRTYRPNDELKLLREIRAGLVPFNDVFSLANELESKIKVAYNQSSLPENPNMNQINNWLISTYKTYLDFSL